MIADFDGDQDLDLAVADVEGIRILYNVGSGLFELGGFFEFTAKIPFSHPNLAAGDLNGDRLIDLVVATSDFNSSTYSIFVNGGNGTFFEEFVLPCLHTSRIVEMGDLDGDEDLDLVLGTARIISNPPPGNIEIKLNNGDGAFSDGEVYDVETSGSDSSIALSDIDADGDLDVVVASAGGVSVRFNNGDGTLAPRIYVDSNGTNYVAVGDLDNDGSADLVVAGDDIDVILGNGDGTFDSPVSYGATGDFSFGIAVADLDNDGYLDIVTTAEFNRYGNRTGFGSVQ